MLSHNLIYKDTKGEKEMWIPSEIYDAFGMKEPKEDIDVSINQTLTKDDYENVTNASNGKMVFARVSLLREKDYYEDDYEDGKNGVTIADDEKNVLVAFEGTELVKEDEGFGYYSKHLCVQMRIMEGESKGQGRLVPLHNVYVHNYFYEGKIVEDLKKEYETIVSKITSKINVNVYPEFPNITKPIPFDETFQIEPIEKKEYHIPEVHFVDEAEKWMLKNHPEEFVTMSFSNSIGDFLIKPMICFSDIDKDGNDGLRWTTREGRIDIARDYAKNVYGMETVGKEEVEEEIER